MRAVRQTATALRALACCALIAAPLAMAESLPKQRVTGPAGTTVQISTGGSGPSVVLQSGLGDGLEVWKAVWPKLTRFATVFAYDRPGDGGSARIKAARDPCTIATELNELLHAQGLPPPYVLVGHSLGGLYQWVYAAQYPQDVAALVLLDPTHPQHWQRIQRDAPGSAAMLRVLRATFTSTARAEFDNQTGCLAELDAAAVRTVPARLLVRSRYEIIESGDFRRTVESLQADWLTLINAPSIERVPGSSHYLQKERPDVVVRTIRDVLSATAQGEGDFPDTARAPQAQEQE